MAMNKFEQKAFECDILGRVYSNLSWIREDTTIYDAEAEAWIPDAEKIAIIDSIMAKIEKML